MNTKCEAKFYYFLALSPVFIDKKKKHGYSLA